ARPVHRLPDHRPRQTGRSTTGQHPGRAGFLLGQIRVTDETSGASDDTDESSDTDKIPVAQRTEVEHKPRTARTIRVLALPIVVIWVLLAVGVNVFVPQLEKVAEEISVPLSPTDAPSVTGMKHIGRRQRHRDLL